MTVAVATSAKWLSSERGEEAREDLVERARGGDAEAFRSLLDHCTPKLRGYLAGQVRDPSLVDDLVQETLTSAWLALPRYEPRGIPFDAWLRRIAHNKAVDFYRRSRPAVSLDLIDLSGVREPSDIEERALRREQRETLLRALRRLPAEQRRVVLLRFFGELSSLEVGELTGTKPVTVRGQQMRALQSLRGMLDRETLR